MGLLALIREHGDAIEADLAFRGFDLLDLWRGRLTARKVDVLIRGLPPDSATRIALNGRDPLWTRTDHVLADLVDSVNSVAWITANHDRKRSEQTKFPEPYPRPGLVTTKHEVTAAALLAFRERTARR